MATEMKPTTVMLVTTDGGNALGTPGDPVNVTGGGGGVQYAEDSVHSSGDTGTMSLGVRNDTLAALAGSDGDYAPLQLDVNGALYTNAKVFAPGTIDTFGHLITGEISNQIEVQFFRDTPANLLTITTTNSGATSQVGGSGKFETSTNVNGQAKGVTALSTSYRSGSEIFTIFTALFTTPTDAGSYQRIGLYDDNNGMFFGFEGTSFGVTIRKGGSDTTVAKGSFSEDVLTGAAGSRFTRNGTPEAIDLTKLNVYRIRYGWLGSAPIHFEVLSPDDEWVSVHNIRQPNNAIVASVENPDLPMTIDVNKTTSDSTNLIMLTNCWGAGTTNSAIPLDETLTDSTLSKSVRAILAAKKPDGSYQNISSTAGGNLKISVQEISDGLDIGAGNAGSETQRVSIATDDVNLSAIKTAVELIDDAISGSQMQVDVVAALPAGSNLIADVGISGARTSGGATIFRSIDLDEGTLEVVKGSAGQIYWMHVMNLASAVRFVKIYNATSGTIGTGTPVLTFPIPTQGDTNGAGFMLSVPCGIPFDTGISIGASTGVADADTGAPGNNEVIVNLGYA